MKGLLNEGTDGTSTFFKRIQKIKVGSVFHIAPIKQKPLPCSSRGYQLTALLSSYEANLIAFLYEGNNTILLKKVKPKHIHC